MLRGNRRLHPIPGGGNRLDGGYNRPNDGLEDEIISRQVILPPSAFGDCRTRYPCRNVLIRRERLLPRRPPHLGTLPCNLSDHQVALYLRRLGLGTWVLLGFCAPHAAPSFPGTNDLPPPRADAQTKDHPQILGEIQACR